MKNDQSCWNLFEERETETETESVNLGGTTVVHVTNVVNNLDLAHTINASRLIVRSLALAFKLSLVEHVLDRFLGNSNGKRCFFAFPATLRMTHAISNTTTPVLHHESKEPRCVLRDQPRAKAWKISLPFRVFKHRLMYQNAVLVWLCETKRASCGRKMCSRMLCVKHMSLDAFALTPSSGCWPLHPSQHAPLCCSVNLVVQSHIPPISSSIHRLVIA